MRRHELNRLCRGALAASLLSVPLISASACTPASSDDAGVLSDAGHHVIDDSGVHDDAGAGDAGADAGEDPCADPDPTLGTLTLADGFTVVDSALLHANIGAIATAADGEGHRVYGLDIGSGAIVNYGAWPFDLAELTTVFDLLPVGEEDSFYPSWFLAFDGARLAAGYTGAFDAVAGVAPGVVAIYDTTAAPQDALTQVDSDNNFAAAFVGDVLMVQAASLDTLSGEPALYGLGDEPAVVATYPNPAMTFGGHVIATAEGGVVVSGYYGEPAVQHFFLLSADDVAGAMAGTSVALADAEEIAAAPSLTAARFGDGLAYLHGDFFNPAQAVRRVSLADGASRAPVDVLTFSDDCTSVDLLADIGDDLLVGLSDNAGDAGRRLVRLRVAQ